MHDEAYYYDGLVTPSPFHQEWAYYRAAFKRNAIGAHRGSGKSTIIAEEFSLMNLLTRPRSKTHMVLSTMEKVESRFDTLMMQIEHNPRIVADFGQLRPSKGEGIWNRHHLRLANRAILKGSGFTSDGLRGERPHLLLVDDPEYDPKAGTNLARMVGDLEIVLFKVLLPMLRKGCQIFWIGTPISKKLFLWKIINGEDPRTSPDLWNCQMYPVVKPDGTIFWPAEYDEEYIEERRRELGDHFLSEMMCEPGTEEEKPLRIDSAATYYKIVGDPAQETNIEPLQSSTQIAWSDSQPTPDGRYTLVPRQSALGFQFSGLRRAITVDYAPTTKHTSDYSAIHVLGLDRLNQLWSLDLWLGRRRSDDLIRIIWEMARKWQVPLIGVEAVAIQEEFMLRVRDAGEKQSHFSGFTPQVKPIKYRSGLSKGDRIGALEWRFKRGLIKLPEDRKDKWPYKALINQIENFTPDLAGLEYDDAVDSLAMYIEVLKGGPAPKNTEKKKSYLDYLRDGELTIPGTGILSAGGLELDEIPRDVLDKLMGDMPSREKGAHWESGNL